MSSIPTGWRNALAERLGDRAAELILADQRQRYAELYAGRTLHGNRALRTHLEDKILPGLALYLALLNRGLNRPDALSTTQAALEASVLPRRRAMALLARLGLFFPLTRLMVRRVMADGFPAEGWETEWIEVSPGKIAFDIHRCFYLDTLSAYGFPELTAAFCAGDDTIYQDLSPEVHWGRTMTLGRGDRACDFRYDRVTPRPIPRSRSAVGPPR